MNFFEEVGWIFKSYFKMGAGAILLAIGLKLFLEGCIPYLKHLWQGLIR